MGFVPRELKESQMFGCMFNNPFLRTTMFMSSLWGGNTCCDSVTPPSARRVAQSAQLAAMSQAALGPYAWSSNWGNSIQLNSYDVNMPLNSVMELQRMNMDPTYVPGMDMFQKTDATLAAQQQKIEEAKKEGEAWAQKELLKVDYKIALEDATVLNNEIANLLKTEGLSDENKAKFQEIKTKAEELKKKLEDYAKTASEKEVTTAREEVKAIAKEVSELKKVATKTAQEIATAQAEASQHQPAEAEQPAAGEQPVAGTQPEEGNQPVQPEKSQAQLAQDSYNNELRPYICKVLSKNEHLYNNERTALSNKIKEFKAAKGANKVKLYGELVSMIETYQKRIQQRMAAAQKQATQICSDIYTASEGTDLNVFSESENEKKIKDSVKNLNGGNIIATLDEWSQKDYNTKTGDSCMLETIYGEFKASSSTKRELTNHLINCLKAAAYKKGLSADVAREISVIQAELNSTFWSYEKIYNAFNKIHAIIGNPKIEGENLPQE